MAAYCIGEAQKKLQPAQTVQADASPSGGRCQTLWGIDGNPHCGDNLSLSLKVN